MLGLLASMASSLPPDSCDLNWASSTTAIEFTRVDVIKTSPEQAIVRGISEGTVVVFSRVANPYAGMSVSTSPPKPTGKVQSESTAGELL